MRARAPAWRLLAAATLLLAAGLPARSAEVAPVEAPQVELHPLLLDEPSLPAGLQAPQALALDGLALRGARLKDVQGQAVPALGRGEFGVVYPHPAVEGAVIKVVDHSPDVTLFAAATPDETAREEEGTGRALAAAGAGPRYLGRAVFGGRHVSVRERVYGQTLQDLFDGRRYGPDEHALVLAMLDRMARAGLKVGDMRPSNVMIGATRRDPGQRAYVVDGGQLLPVNASASLEQRREELYHQPITLMGRFDPNVGWIETIRPFSQLLEKGLARRNDKTFWQKLKRLAKDMWSAPFFPPAR